MVRDIANTTCVDVAIEEHRYVAIDRRTADGASLAVTSRLKRFPKRRHATRLCPEENKAAERNMIARRLRHARSGWGAISGAGTLIAFALRRNESRALRLMPALRLILEPVATANRRNLPRAFLLLLRVRRPPPAGAPARAPRSFHVRCAAGFLHLVARSGLTLRSQISFSLPRAWASQLATSFSGNTTFASRSVSHAQCLRWRNAHGTSTLS
jgi:hypothetical protein